MGVGDWGPDWHGMELPCDDDECEACYPPDVVLDERCPVDSIFLVGDYTPLGWAADTRSTPITEAMLNESRVRSIARLDLRARP